MIPPAAPGILGAESLPMTGPRLCPGGPQPVNAGRPAADGPGRAGQRLRLRHCWVSAGKCRAFTPGLCGFLIPWLRIKTRTALGIKTRSGN